PHTPVYAPLRNKPHISSIPWEDHRVSLWVRCKEAQAGRGYESHQWKALPTQDSLHKGSRKCRSLFLKALLFDGTWSVYSRRHGPPHNQAIMQIDFSAGHSSCSPRQWLNNPLAAHKPSYS